jgi:RimJ/RimL family protein N-acetyltransferase
MNINGKIVTLRAIEEEDLGLLMEMFNDPDIEWLIGEHAYPISMAHQKNWFANFKNDQNNIRLMIDVEGEGAVGFVSLVNIDWKNRSAFHGIKIGRRKSRKRGVGTDAVMAIMRYAFEELQLNRLDGIIIEHNQPSKKLYCGRCGWKVEGVKRKSVFKRNRYCDQELVGILNEEYFELIEKNNYWETNK